MDSMPQKQNEQEKREANTTFTMLSFVDYLNSDFGIAKKDAKVILQGLEDRIKHVFDNKHNRFMMQGLFTISSVERKARTGRNPKTGEALAIPAKTTLRIKVSSKF